MYLRMLADQPDYQKRISAGKNIEQKILNALRDKGYKIEDPTPSEDMHDKIDGWWINKKGTRFPVQVKYRETGDDIIFELVQDFSTKNLGRDMKTKAVVYIVTDTHRITRMFLVKPIKEKAQEITKVVLDALRENPTQTAFSGKGWQAKVQTDRAHGQRKLMAYLSPSLFSALATWNLNF